MSKRKIWIRRKDNVRQRYLVGQKPRKNYGSKMFREQIKKEIYGYPIKRKEVVSILNKLPPRKDFKFIGDPKVGQKFLIRTLEKNPNLMQDLRGSNVVFFESEERDAPLGFADKELIAINKKLLNTEIIGLDPLTKSKKLYSFSDVLKHETSHLKQKELSPEGQQEFGAQLATHLDIRKEKPPKVVMEEAEYAFFKGLK